MYGRILVKDRSDQMVEALDQSCASEGLCDELGRRLSSQFLRGHAVGIGRIDDRLPLPVGERLRDIRVRFETDRQKDEVRLDRFRQCFGDDRGSDRVRIGCKFFGSRVVATDTSMPLRANALARAWPILPKPIIA
jgi:hypothetical protein